MNDNYLIALKMTKKDEGLTAKDLKHLSKAMNLKEDHGEAMPVIITSDGDSDTAVGLMDKNLYQQYISDDAVKNIIDRNICNRMDDWELLNEDDSYTLSLPDSTQINYCLF